MSYTYAHGVGLPSCDDCGAVVRHTGKHDAWHEKIDNHGHSYAAAYGPGGEWDVTTGPRRAKKRLGDERPGPPW